MATKAQRFAAEIEQSRGSKAALEALKGRSAITKATARTLDERSEAYAEAVNELTSMEDHPFPEELESDILFFKNKADELAGYATAARAMA